MSRYIEHAKAIKASEDLRKELLQRRAGTLIPLIGVAGVGKSTIRRRVLRELFATTEWFKDGRLPVVEIYTGLPDKAFFSSKSVARRSGGQLIHPALRWMKPMEGEPPGFYDTMSAELASTKNLTQAVSRRMQTEAGYWEGFAEMAVERGLQVLSYDHCNSMLVNRRGTEPVQHCQHLMTLADENEFALLLTGTPGATELWDALPELFRRARPVWVESYTCETEEEVQQVADLLRTVAGDILTKPKNLLEKIGFEIVFANGGVFDLMRTSVDGAKENAARDGRRVLIARDFEQSYPTEKATTAIWESVRIFNEARARISRAAVRRMFSEKRS